MVVVVVLLFRNNCQAFLPFSKEKINSRQTMIRKKSQKRQSKNQYSTKLMSNFFRDMLEKAFENDDNSRMNEIDGDDENSLLPPPQKQLTATQLKWREQQKELTMNDAGKISNVLSNTIAVMDFYLVGVPNKDPSDDLYGAQVTITSRDRQTNLNLPEVPTLTNIHISFPKGGADDASSFQCACLNETDFTIPETMGDWKLSNDNDSSSTIRFRIPVHGYTKRVETKGSIQSVYWSNEPDQVIETATVYSIPPGWMYGEAELSLTKTGTLVWSKGVLKVEQSSGWLGVVSKLVPCGTFNARSIRL